MHVATQQSPVTMTAHADAVFAARALRSHASPNTPDPLAREFVIEGVTRAGKPFRPSDWAERLAGALSSFRPKGLYIGAHLTYSPYCVPRVVGGVKCVIVNEALREVEPMAWDFAMNFARDNDLRLHERVPGEGVL